MCEAVRSSGRLLGVFGPDARDFCSTGRIWHRFRREGLRMEGFKEFEGKSLDMAIRDACEYYNAVREKLEIEIIQDAKSGIFGLVGARKAKIRARRAALREAVASALGKNGRRAEAAETGGAPVEGGAGGENARPPRGERSRQRRSEGEAAETRRQRAPRKASPRGAGPEAEDSGNRSESDRALLPAGPSLPAVREKGVSPATDGREGVAAATSAGNTGRESGALPDDTDAGDDMTMRNAATDIDPERLAALAGETVERLVRPIAGDDIVLKAEVLDGRVRVSVDGAEDSGLLIGREGQTLAALQYLASRIVSRAVNAAVRVQLDAGRYRQRQDEKLREIALALAERVRETGRSFSTRPLSSYHRRIVHLALQDAPDVQTRSTGEGPLKRVVICRRRPERGQA